MTARVSDRVHDSTVTTGTGALTLSGTAPNGGFVPVTASWGFASGDTFNYAVSDQSGSNWETGPGSISSLSPTVLARANGTTVFPYGSSNTTTGSITGATNAAPIVITSAGHGLTTNQYVSITGVGGNTAANGYFVVGTTTTNTFALTYVGGNSVVGNGNYTSGGTWVAYGLVNFTAGTKDVLLTISSPNLVSLSQRNTYNIAQSAGSAVSWNVTQNTPNSPDVLDNIWDLEWTISASSAVNEFISRTLKVGATNSLTGGGAVSNMRVVELQAVTSSGAVTSEVDYINLVEVNSGTVTTSTGLRAASGLLGTNQAFLACGALTGTNSAYALFGLDVTGLPAGHWTIYSADSSISYLTGPIATGVDPNATVQLYIAPPGGTQPFFINWTPVLSPSLLNPIALNVGVSVNSPYISGLGFSGGVSNIETTGNVGVQGAAVGSYSTAGGIEAITNIWNMTGGAAEPITWLGILGYYTSNLTDCHTPGRAWFTDWNLSGAIGVQQSALSAITMNVQNSYYGPTIHGESAGLCVITRPPGGASASFEHNNSPDYAFQTGVSVVGWSSGTGPLTVNSGTTSGYVQGIQVGGCNGNWHATVSHLTTGIEISDCSGTGLYIHRTYNGVTGVVLTQRVTAATIGSGGSGYGVSQTFNATLVGGTFATAAVVNVTSNASGVVTTVNSITTAGNYSGLPTSPVATTGGTGTGLTLNPTWTLNSGTGYTSTPTLTIGAAPAAGITATGTPYLTGTTVASLAIITAGQGFTSLPTLVLDNPFPAVNGVIATANVSTMKAVLAGTTIGSGGTGYGNAQTFNATVVGGTFTTAAVVNVTSNAAGVVITINSITTAGSYTVLPALPAATTGGTGTGLTLNVSFGILAVTLVNAGSGYGANPSVTIVGGGGTGAGITAALTPTTLAGFAINNPGLGYTSVPTVTITGGGASTQALAAATIGSAVSGLVTGVNITNQGAGYGGAAPPAITFTGGGGYGASGRAICNINGGIVGVMMTNYGTGYTSAPTVSFATTNAQATATCKLGALTAPVSAGGSGYAVGDVLQISGGTSNPAARLTVATLSGSAVATVTISQAGNYSSLSGVASPAATTAVTGVGSGATFTMTWSLVDVHITNVGGFYTSAPTAAFTPASTTAVTPTLAVNGGVLLTCQPITNAGSYTTAQGVPTVAFSGGLSAVTQATGYAILGGVALAVDDDAGTVIIGGVVPVDTGKLNILGTLTFPATAAVSTLHVNTALVPSAVTSNLIAQVFAHPTVSDVGVAAGGFAISGEVTSVLAGFSLLGTYNQSVSSWVAFHANTPFLGSGTIGTQLGFFCDALRAQDFGFRSDGIQANTFGGPCAFAGNSTGFAFTPTAAVDIQWNTALTTALNSINNTVTWNAGGVVFTNWLMNVTNTASAAGSKLVDLQVGAVSKFSVDKTGLIANEGLVNARVTANVTQNTTTQINATGLSFAIGANELWTFEAHLSLTQSGTKAVTLGVTGPASPTDLNLMMEGNVGAVTAWTGSVPLTAFGNFATALITAAFTGIARVYGVVNNGVNAGTVQITFGTNITTSGTTATVNKNSYIVARRIS